MSQTRSRSVASAPLSAPRADAAASVEIARLVEQAEIAIGADTARAEAVGREAYTLACAAGEPLLLARAEDVFGIATASAGRPFEGLALLESAVRRFASLGLIDAEIDALRHLGSVQGNYLDRTDDALGTFQRALQLATSSGDGAAEARILAALGALFGRLQRVEEARSAFERAIALLRSGDDFASRAKALNNLAYLHVQCGRYAEAVPIAFEAIATTDPVAQRVLLIGERCTCAVALAGTGRGDEALALLAANEQELPGFDEPYYRADHYLTAAKVQLLLAHPAAALEALQQGQDIATAAQLDSYAVPLLALRAEIAEASGDIATALQHLKALREAERRTLDAEAAAKVRSLEASMRLQERERENTSLLETQSTLESRVAERTAELAAEVEERRRAEERAEYLARHDWLTDLPNRRGLHEALEDALADARRNNGLVGALFVDIDRFKSFNDAHGHLVADQVLRIVAERFRGLLAPPSQVFRFGGDEFLLLVRDALSTQQIMRVAQSALDALDPPVGVDRTQLRVACSVGIAVFPEDAAGVDDLLRKADHALLLAKERGRNRVVRLDRTIARAMERRMRLEQDLLHALDRREMLLHFQPQWDLRQDRVVGMEALLRWAHPTFGIVPPNEFIPLAEEHGVISALGAWALKEACRASARLHKRLGRGADERLVVGVNVSAQQLRSESLIVDIRSALADSGLDPANLELELTESLLLSEDAATLVRVNAIRKLGVKFALDDFGNGYSSFSYLHRVRFDRLKIDRSIVNESTLSPEKAIVTQAIIAMAHGLKLDVVAEGVETAEQRALLEAQGCDQIQGFLVAEPITGDELANRLRQRTV
jgi:diguanylate cyclase (GGDEF)-like protein